MSPATVLDSKLVSPATFIFLQNLVTKFGFCGRFQLENIVRVRGGMDRGKKRLYCRYTLLQAAVKLKSSVKWILRS